MCSWPSHKISAMPSNWSGENSECFRHSLAFFIIRKTRSNYFLFGHGIDSIMLLPLFAWIIRYFSFIFLSLLFCSSLNVNGGVARKGFINSPFSKCNRFIVIYSFYYCHSSSFCIRFFFMYPPKSLKRIEFYFHSRYFASHCVIRVELFNEEREWAFFSR